MAHEGIVHLPLAAHHFAQGGLNFIGGNLLRVAIVGQIEKAALGAHPAVGTNFQPGSQTGLEGLLYGRPEGVGINVQRFHLFVVLLAALVCQQGVQLFFRIHRLFVAKDSFGHDTILPYCGDWSRKTSPVSVGHRR
jgi:hypothetical protein